MDSETERKGNCSANTSYLGIVVTLLVDKDYSKQYVDTLKDMIATLHVYQR